MHAAVDDVADSGEPRPARGVADREITSRWPFSTRWPAPWKVAGAGEPPADQSWVAVCGTCGAMARCPRRGSGRNRSAASVVSPGGLQVSMRVKARKFELRVAFAVEPADQPVARARGGRPALGAGFVHDHHRSDHGEAGRTADLDDDAARIAGVPPRDRRRGRRRYGLLSAKKPRARAPFTVKPFSPPRR